MPEIKVSLTDKIINEIDSARWKPNYNSTDMAHKILSDLIDHIYKCPRSTSHLDHVLTDNQKLCYRNGARQQQTDIINWTRGITLEKL